MILVIFWTVVAFCCAIVAGNKGRSSFGWFILGVLFSLLALLVVACLPSLKAQTPQVVFIDESGKPVLIDQPTVEACEPAPSIGGPMFIAIMVVLVGLIGIVAIA